MRILSRKLHVATCRILAISASLSTDRLETEHSMRILLRIGHNQLICHIVLSPTLSEPIKRMQLYHAPEESYKYNLRVSYTIREHLGPHEDPLEQPYQTIGSVDPCPQNRPPCSFLEELTISSAYNLPASSGSITPGTAPVTLSCGMPISAAARKSISVATIPNLET